MCPLIYNCCLDSEINLCLYYIILYYILRFTHLFTSNIYVDTLRYFLIKILFLRFKCCGDLREVSFNSWREFGIFNMKRELLLG